MTGLRGGHKIFACGNGGSRRGTHKHLVAELIGRFSSRTAGRFLPLPSTADAATLTAIGNDYGYERVFCTPARGTRTKRRPAVCDQHQR